MAVEPSDGVDPRCLPKVPVILVSGVDADVMAIASAGLVWDLPGAVAVRHDIDPAREVLIRTVSDVTGVIEREEIDVEHACVSCAIREDVVPTLERLAASGFWEAVVAQLPPTAEAAQVCRVVDQDAAAAPSLRVSAVVAALDGTSVSDDLLGVESLTDLDLPVREDDERGIGEVTCALTEFADVVVVAGGAQASEMDLVRTLARPGVLVVDDIAVLDAATLASGVHDCAVSDAWVEDVRRGDLPLGQGDAWVLDIRSHRPLHPGRLDAMVEQLGGGARRSRGCFWLPTRPFQVCAWDGAGGLLSIGSREYWGRETPLTRIVVVGLDDGREALREAFESCLLTDAELAERGPYWEASEDGFEPWLGPIRRVA